MRRVVYACDWCGAEAPPGKPFGGEEEPIPDGWGIDSELRCLDCRVARAEALLDVEAKRRVLRLQKR